MTRGRSSRGTSCDSVDKAPHERLSVERAGTVKYAVVVRPVREHRIGAARARRRSSPLCPESAGPPAAREIEIQHDQIDTLRDVLKPIDLSRLPYNQRARARDGRNGFPQTVFRRRKLYIPRARRKPRCRCSCSPASRVLFWRSGETAISRFCH